MVEPTLQTLGLGLASAAKIIQALNKLVSGDARAQVAALYDVILAAQTSAMEANLKQSAMIDRIRELEEEVTRIKAWERQKQRYKLHTPWAGIAVYALKNSMSEGEPAHWICTHCYEDGRRSILQFGHRKESVRGGYICPSCDTMMEVPFRGPTADIPYAPD
ncbi:MAG: hypothetical protein A3H27_06590 [Acidobacteria bacterium RIFCSPLOWO2_02_FULL_59_13]|nr:MAG: hypothetical protein A3H27_06590 [Acidobacteria bacterium RIFCSPLOWO2_02_FULL_59_13]